MCFSKLSVKEKYLDIAQRKHGLFPLNGKPTTCRIWEGTVYWVSQQSVREGAHTLPDCMRRRLEDSLVLENHNGSFFERILGGPCCTKQRLLSHHLVAGYCPAPRAKRHH